MSVRHLVAAGALALGLVTSAVPSAEAVGCGQQAIADTIEGDPDAQRTAQDCMSSAPDLCIPKNVEQAISCAVWNVIQWP